MATLEAGRLLANRYLLQDRLGDGGHAEVWKARDSRDGRSVALKFLHLGGAGAEESLRVLRHEAAMAHDLQHPGVLNVFEPERDDGLVFLPMEFAAGGDASWLRGAPWQRVLPVLLQTARVLEHAHARGVVHRDLKARNVLFDALGNVRLSDFGAAARTGRSDAPAAGSPFSASPQQLRDEPADPADDVYGLGALAYELLTRYPPFYPNFDARRVQSEDPAPPAPVHPAPAGLLALVQSMLSRDAAMRPGLAEVIDVLERQLATAGTAPDHADVPLVDEPAQPARARSAGARSHARNLLPWVAGIAVAAAGVVVMMWLPSPAPQPVAATAPTEPAPIRVDDAVIAAPEPVPTPTPGKPPPPADSTSMDAVRAGRAALAAMQPERARAAFEHALSLEPDQPDAREGLAASARLTAQLEAMAEGARLEARGELPEAAEQYRRLLAADASFAPAGSALARVQQRLREQKLDDLINAGADALRRGQVSQAESAYRQAAALEPKDVRVLEGQRRLEEVQTSQLNAGDLATGARLEEEEQWDEALAHYRAVLARDPQLAFAQDGLARSERRAALDHELRDYLARPERLTATSVRQAAERALARGEATSGGAPRLQHQLRQLRGLVAQLATEVRVDITSDNSTSVTLAPLGELGSFSRRALELRPGHYVLIGRREGFRDVRYELDISPGQDAATLSVQCTERI